VSDSKSFEPFNNFCEDILRNRDKKKYGCTMELDSSLSQTLRQMINADVLIMSKSSFSYVPAMLNPSTVVYPTSGIVDAIIGEKRPKR
jgi:hypothetical protein